MSGVESNVVPFSGRVAGIVLAGGLSRRMGGGDKPLLELGGRPMLATILDRLRPQVDTVAINANGNPERFAPFGAPVIADTIEGHAGPLAGILAGMRWAGRNLRGARAIITVAGDTPFFPIDLVERLNNAVADLDGPVIALCGSAGHVHPVFGRWPIALADPLEQFLTEGEERKILAFADRHRRVSAEFQPYRSGPAEFDPFFNINTPDDIAEGEAIAAALAEGGIP